MSDLLASRIMLMLLILAAVAGGALAAAYVRFPDSLLIILPVAAALGGGIWFILRKERLARFEAFYSTVQEFGTPISFQNVEGAFERDGTRFDIAFPQGENHTYFRVKFFLPDIAEKFSIQNRTLATVYEPDCVDLSKEFLPEEYLVQARNAEFARELFENRLLLGEVLNYKASFWGGLKLGFADGSFDFQWVPPIADQVEGLYKVCRTAVVFHDELRKLAKK